MIITLRQQLYRTALFRACHTTLTLAQPFLLKRIISMTFLKEFSLLTLVLNSFAAAILFFLLSVRLVRSFVTRYEILIQFYYSFSNIRSKRPRIARALRPGRFS